MRIKAKVLNGKIILSEPPKTDIKDGLLLKMSMTIHLLNKTETNFIMADIIKGQTDYLLTDKVQEKDIKAIYVRAY